MKRYLFVLLVLACTLPLWALDETVTVTAGDTETLPTTVSDDLQTLADDNGLTLLGWTTSPIADGHRPATYYGLGATVTPASNTTYYAFFARSANPGELIIRQAASPADGDSVLLAFFSGGMCLLALNTETKSNVQLSDKTSSSSASLLKLSYGESLSFSWIYLDYSVNQFYLRSAVNETNYLNAASSLVRSSNQSGRTMQIIGGLLYCVDASKYLGAGVVSEDYALKTYTSLSSQSFAFYRKERYVDFCTSIEEPAPCPNCFIYTP